MVLLDQTAFKRVRIANTKLITNGTCLFGCSVGFEGEACKEEACAYTNQWIKIPLYWFNNDWFIKTNIFQVFL